MGLRRLKGFMILRIMKERNLKNLIEFMMHILINQ